MPLPRLIISLTDSVSNRYLHLDPDSRERLQHLAGKTLTLHIAPIPSFSLRFDATRVYLLDTPAPTVDTTISLTGRAVLQLIQHKGQWLDLIREGLLNIQGDMQVASAFATLCQKHSPDIEDYLSEKVGDVAAYSLVNSSQRLWKRLKKSRPFRKSFVRNTLVDEWRVTPGADEIQSLTLKTQQLQYDVQTLETRLIRLQQKADLCK